MKIRPEIFFGAALVAGALAIAGSVGEFPDDPHDFMEEEGKCGDCHTYWEGKLEPHMFSILIHEKCRECHSHLGRSHPININPDSSDLDLEVPEELPLAYMDEIGDDVVSCGTCHNPHGEWLSSARAYSKQTAEFVDTADGEEISYFKTYYLRIPGDPEEGFVHLCIACHSRDDYY